MNKPRKIIQFFTYYLLPILLLSGSIFLNNKWVFSKYGNLAFILLAANLYLRPIAVIINNRYLNILTTYRRELGVGSFWFYLFHAAGFFLLYKIPLLNFINTRTYSFWALLASICMWLLWITSNDKSINLLKRNWKRLHRLAYPLFYFSLIHVSLAQKEPEKIIILGVPYIILKIFEYRKIPLRW